MPLHGQRETGRIPDREGFNQAVFGHRLDCKPLAKAIHALCMQRVDFRALLSADSSQQSVAAKINRMRCPVAVFERHLPVFPVVEKARDLVHRRVQAAAPGHVHFLQAAADGEHRHAGLHGRWQELEYRAIPVCVLPGIVRRRRAAVSLGLNVRRAASQQQAIQPVQDVRYRELPTHRRQHDREGAGAVDDGVQVAVAGQLRPVRMVGQAAAVRRHTDQRAVAPGYRIFRCSVHVPASCPVIANHVRELSPDRLAYTSRPIPESTGQRESKRDGKQEE